MLIVAYTIFLLCLSVLWKGRGYMTQLPDNQRVTYQFQYRKCGKATCSTCRNGRGHGPYWYAYWNDGSRLRSGYIGKVRPEKLCTPVVPVVIEETPEIAGEEPSAVLAL